MIDQIIKTIESILDKGDRVELTVSKMETVGSFLFCRK